MKTTKNLFRRTTIKYDKIIRAGINGCGNIVVEQILNYLFNQENNELDGSRPGFYRPANINDRVIHTFRYLDNLEPGNSCHVAGLGKLHLGVIIPNRDFRSVVASQMRKRGIIPTVATITKIYRDLFLIMYRERHKYTTIFPNPKDVLILDYRKFFGNLDYLMDKLELFLEINITDTQRLEIHQKFSLGANRKIANRMNNWDQMDTESGVHGKHIGTGKPDSWKTFFPSELHEFVTKLMWSELVAYGWES